MGFITKNNKVYTTNDAINDIKKDIGESYLQDTISQINIDENAISEIKEDLDNEIDVRINSDLDLTNTILTKTESLKNELENLNINLLSNDEDLLNKLKTEQEYTKSLLLKIKELNEDLEVEVISRINKDIEIKQEQDMDNKLTQQAFTDLTQLFNTKLTDLSNSFDQKLNAQSELSKKLLHDQSVLFDQKLKEQIESVNIKLNQQSESFNQKLSGRSESLNQRLNDQSELFNQKLKSTNKHIDDIFKEFNYKNERFSKRLENINYGLYQFYMTLLHDPRCKPYSEHLLEYIKSSKEINHHNYKYYSKHHKHDHTVNGKHHHYHYPHNNFHDNHLDTYHQGDNDKYIHVDKIDTDEDTNLNDTPINDKKDRVNPVSYYFDKSRPAYVKGKKYHDDYYSYYNSDHFHSPDHHNSYSSFPNRNISIYSDKIYLQDETSVNRYNYAEFYKALNSTKDKYKYNKLLI